MLVAIAGSAVDLAPDFIRVSLRRSLVAADLIRALRRCDVARVLINWGDLKPRD